MTKNLLPLVFVFLCTLFSVNAQTTPIPDANFEQFLVDEGIDTNGVNGNILDVDAEAVTNINVTRNDITDFTGLEAFVNLVTLDTGTNQFASLPLNNLSVLEELIIDDNDALNNLNLSNNTALRTLDIESWVGGAGNGNEPPITSLDLSQNTLLESVELKQLTNLSNVTFPITSTLTYVETRNLACPTLDYSQLSGLEEWVLRGSQVGVNVISPIVKTSLKKVEIGSMDFPTLDLTGYNVLESLRLSSTDIANLTLPTTSTFTNLSIWHHDFTAPLDLSNVPGLTNLDVRFAKTVPLVIDLTQNPLLETVWLTSNMMNSVDLTQNTAIRTLYIYSNNLTSLNVTQNTVINTLDASRNQLTGIDLSQNADLEYLTLSANQIPTLDVTNNFELRILRISENLFTATGLDLTQNQELFQLHVNNNQIESLDITQNPELNYLDISHNLFPGNNILQQFTDLISAQGRLRGALIANNNLLSGSIPDFYGLYDSAVQTRRFRLHLGENRFHFGDFEDQHLDLFDLTTTMSIGPSPDWVIDQYTYAPQAKVNTIDSPSRNAGDNITLTTTVRGTQNHYKWFKDGVEIIDAPDAPEYTITDLNTCDAGVYHSEITSDLVPFENASAPGTAGRNLLLVRNDITLTVNATKDCVTLDMPLTNVPINSGLQWNDNPGACGYKISVGTTSGGTDVVNNEDVGEVSVYNFGSDLNPNQDYFVNITPYYDDGDFTGCTELSFRTNATTVAPDCTSLSSSLAGRNDVAVDANIEWEPANGADSYSIFVGTTPGGTEIFTGTVGSDLFYDPSTDFTAGTTIYVTIVPENTEGPAVGCAEESFTIRSSPTTPVAPTCTSLTSPTTTDAPIGTTQMTWNAVPNATGYRITITGTANNDISNAEVATNMYPFPGTFVNGETATVTIIPFNGTVDAVGCSNETFTIEAAAPAVPECTSITSPAATDAPIGTTQMTWNAVPNATGYRITITGTANNNITNAEVATNMYPFPGTFVNGETATVTIIPFNGTVDAVGCSDETFTIEAAAPAVPECTSLVGPGPIDEDTGIAATVESISWNPSVGADAYRIAITSTSGNNDLPLTDVGNNLTYPFPTSFQDGDIVIVTIVPYNTTGSPEPCIDQSFTIAASTPMPPSCTSLAPELIEATEIAVDAALSWNEIDNATGYRLSVNTETGETILENEDVGLLTTYSLPENLPFGTTIFVAVTPYNAVGAADTCPEQSFTTMQEPEDPEEPIEEDETKYGFSPDGDGINEFWEIDNIEDHPVNVVTIFNRWGDAVFRIDNYDNGGSVFRGEANLKTKMGAGILPAGTYFFNIEIEGVSTLKKTQGYLVLKR